MIPAPTYGLVICGGKSTRMGTDKSMITYYNKPQYYHMYEMLQPLCDKVFICCNAKQAHQYKTHLNIMTDLHKYENAGPVAALLTAYGYHPYVNFLMTGCDYPFITFADLQNLVAAGEEQNITAALYNEIENLYEPLLAWYPSEAAKAIAALFDVKQYSLQYFLKNRTAKIFPVHKKSIISVDTPDAFAAVKKQFK